MNKTIGFIGVGNMSTAMIEGIIRAELVDKKNIIGSDCSEEYINKKEEELGIRTTLDNKEVARESDYLIIGVKPNQFQTVLDEIREDVKEGATVISIGAGISLNFLKENLKEGTKIIKTIPNTPSLVGEGMSAMSLGEGLTEEDAEEALEIFRSFGEVDIIDESLMDGYTALCGSSPAYIYMLIEAMGDAGVKEGLPRDLAYKMAAQTTLGSAKMVLETGEHPGRLKDNVCSPAGTTIDAVIALEEAGFRSAIMKAMRICAHKSESMNR